MLPARRDGNNSLRASGHSGRVQPFEEASAPAMDFALTEDQEMIRASAESFLAAASPSAAVRRAMATPAGYDAALWEELAGKLGWCATTIAVDHGGLGLGMVEQALLMEQMGRRLLCAPFFSTACLAVTALQEAGDEAARARYLPDIAAGRLTASLAFATSGIEWIAGGPFGRAGRDGEDFVLTGRYRHVPDGATAGLLLLTAVVDDEPAPSLFALAGELPGLERQTLQTLDATRRLAEVRVAGLRVPAAARIGTPDRTVPGLERTSALAAIALAAEQLGGAQQCLDLTRAYLGELRQFLDVRRQRVSEGGIQLPREESSLALVISNLATQALGQSVQGPCDRKGRRRQELAHHQNHQGTLARRECLQLRSLQVLRDHVVELEFIVGGAKLLGDWHPVRVLHVFHDLAT